MLPLIDSIQVEELLFKGHFRIISHISRISFIRGKMSAFIPQKARLSLPNVSKCNVLRHKHWLHYSSVRRLLEKKERIKDRCNSA